MFKHTHLLTDAELETFLGREGFSSLPPGIDKEMLEDASLLICEICQQFFDKRELVIELDGTGTKRLPSKWPILTISKIEVKADNSTAEFAEITDFKPYRDKIMRTDAIFPLGSRNVRVSGAFGWESVPPLIKKACKLLILDDLNPRGAINSRIASEQVSGHSISVEKREQRAKYTGNLDVDNILVRYIWRPPRPRVHFGIIPTITES